LPEAQRFLGDHWKRGHILASDAELFGWQHQKPDDPDHLSVVVARGEDGELQGMLGVIASRFCARGEKCPAAWLTTWIVPERFRSAGTGLRLLQRVLQETPGLVGTLGGNEVTMRLLGTMGFKLWPAIPRWVRGVSRPALESLLAAAGPVYPDECWDAWLRERPTVPTAPAVPVTPWSDRSPGPWDAAWRTRFAPRLVGTWRDAAYLRWRYLDHPRFTYRVLLAGDATNGAPGGLGVYRVQQVRGRPEVVVRVVELLAEGPATGALIAAIAGDAEAMGAAFIDFYCTAPAVGMKLEGHGFVRDDVLPVSLPALFQPLDAGRTALTGALKLTLPSGGPGEQLLGSDELYVTRSDCDQDRPN
jgi:hypothetical protein